MILTIALNPSIVRHIYMQELNPGYTNTVISDELSIGDCGIYSAYVLKVMQVDPYVMGISGGIGGRFVKNFLDRNRIKTDFLQVDHEIKSLLLITDRQNNRTTSIISHNNELSQKDFVNIKHKLNHHLTETQLVAISGEDDYLPGIIDDIIAMSRDVKKIVVNAVGEIVPEILNKRIFAVQINTNDLETLGIEFEATEICFEKIRLYQKERHIRYLILKSHSKIYGFTKNKICSVDYIEKDSIYPISASAIFGGLIVGVRRNYQFERMMKLIGALATTCSLNDYPFVIKRQDVNQSVNKVKIHEIYNTRNGYRIEC